MTSQLDAPQPTWLRPTVGGGVALVALLTMLLDNCLCDPNGFTVRLAPVLLIGALWAIELFAIKLPGWLLSLAVAMPVGVLIVTRNGSVAALFLLLLVGWQMYVGSLRDGLVAAGLSILAVLGYAHYDSPDRWLPWTVGIAATTLMMYLFAEQQRLVAQLRSAQADLARQAVAAERRRIAFEIHDVAAHSLAVTLLHLTGARLRAQRQGGDPDLIEALAAAERLGRQSLDDVRRTVGLLQESAAATAPPQPDAADIVALIEEYRAAGLDVRFDLRGDAATLPPAAGLALYRIAQEALANAVKHAPGAAVQIALDFGREARLRVRNDLPTISTNGGSGLGLGSMRERAQLLGGSLRAGPENGAWVVDCAIPAWP